MRGLRADAFSLGVARASAERLAELRRLRANAAKPCASFNPRNRLAKDARLVCVKLTIASRSRAVSLKEMATSDREAPPKRRRTDGSAASRGDRDAYREVAEEAYRLYLACGCDRAQALVCWDIAERRITTARGTAA